MSKGTRFAIALVATSALTAVYSTSASAQQTSQGGGATEDRQLPEIVVTGDRLGTEVVQVGSFRGAEVLDTPLTISVVTKDLIQQQQATSVLDALRNTPGVTSSQTSPTVYNNLSIRGIPVDNRENFRLNGSLPIINLIDLPLENKARVEALKGASALYYGFTTPSGIINLTTEAAPKDPLLVIEAYGNSHGQAGGRFDGGDTFGSFGFRTNLSYGSVESGINNTRGERNFQSGRFELAPADGLKLSFDVEHIYKKVTEPTVVQIATTATVVPRLVDPATNPGGYFFYSTAEEVNLLLHAAYSFSPSWTISGDVGQSRATRDRNFTRLNAFDPVTGNGKLTLSAARGQIYRNRTIRGEIAGTFATGPVVHEFLAGVTENVQDQYSPSAKGLTSANCIALGLPGSCIQNYYTPVDLTDWGSFDASTPYNPSRDTRLDDLGYYAFDRMSFGGVQGDLVSVLVGARKSIYKEFTVADGQTYKATPLSLSGGLVIKPVDWVSLYGTYIEGLESTPPAPLTAANASEQLGASKSTQYEAGIKIKPRRGLLFTASYFDIARELTYTNSANVFVKDGRATYRGLETSLTGQVTNDLSIYASALFLSAKQGQTSDPALIGNRIENTAKTTWSVSAQYKLDTLVPGLAITGGAFHVGDRATSPQNTLFLPGYTTFDLGGSLAADIGGRELTFRVYGENITGERYFASTGSNYIAFGVPPSIKFSVTAALF